MGRKRKRKYVAELPTYKKTRTGPQTGILNFGHIRVQRRAAALPVHVVALSYSSAYWGALRLRKLVSMLALHDGHTNET